LADEPTASLDESNSDAVLALFKRVNLEDGVAVVLTTTSDSDRFPSTIEFRIREARLVPCGDGSSGVSGDGGGGGASLGSRGREGIIGEDLRRAASTDVRPLDQPGKAYGAHQPPSSKTVRGSSVTLVRRENR
jgi:hypothetical protein